MNKEMEDRFGIQAEFKYLADIQERGIKMTLGREEEMIDNIMDTAEDEDTEKEAPRHSGRKYPLDVLEPEWKGKILYQNYINGKWNEEISETFESKNPATNELLGVFPKSDSYDVDLAVQTAKKAYPYWRRISRIKRAEYLNNLCQFIKIAKPELEILVTQECGKPINEGSADVVESIHMIQYVCGEAGMPCGTVLASEISEKEAFMKRKSIGVMGVITPWNFPAAIPLWLIAPSLLEGNTVVFKPSEETPLVARELIKLFEKAGFPPGVINLVQGEKETGAELVKHAGIDRILFTGSAKTAEWIVKTQAELYPHRLPPICEKGGKNALIVLDDADMEMAIDSALLSAFKTSGQRCVSAGRIIVDKKIIDEFSERFTEKAKKIKVGNPLNPDTLMGPIINKAAFDKIMKFNNEIMHRGINNFKILWWGGWSEIPNNVYFVKPFVYRIKTWWFDCQPNALKEEVFGPHVAIIPAEDIADAVKIYNDTDYGLSCAVITEDYRKFRYCFEECDAGIYYHNLPTIGAESRIQLPFGGVKKSGMGMPSAGYLVDAVTHKTAVTINYGREIKMAQGLSEKI